MLLLISLILGLSWAADRPTVVTNPPGQALVTVSTQTSSVSGSTLAVSQIIGLSSQTVNQGTNPWAVSLVQSSVAVYSVPGSSLTVNLSSGTKTIGQIIPRAENDFPMTSTNSTLSPIGYIQNSLVGYPAGSNAQEIQGAGANASAIANSAQAVLIGATDGTNKQIIKSNTSGNLDMTSTIFSQTAGSSNSGLRTVLAGGADTGGTVRLFSTDPNGILNVVLNLSSGTSNSDFIAPATSSQTLKALAQGVDLQSRNGTILWERNYREFTSSNTASGTGILVTTVLPTTFSKWGLSVISAGATLWDVRLECSIDAGDNFDGTGTGIAQHTNASVTKAIIYAVDKPCNAYRVNVSGLTGTAVVVKVLGSRE